MKQLSYGKTFLISVATFAALRASVSASSDGLIREGDLAELTLDQLMSVEVTTPGKVPERVRDTPASVYLIGRDDIERQGYMNLTEILADVPGMYNINNYEGVSGNLGMRGFWNGRSQNGSVAILVNGIPQMNAGTWSHPMESLNLPVEAIDRIEVIRGPNSVIYGNGASFGAINIITDESFYDDQVVVSYGSRDTKRMAARWSAFGERSHVIVNAGTSSTDGPDPRLSDLMSPESVAALSAAIPVDPNSDLDGRLENERKFLQLAGMWRDLYVDFTYDSADTELFYVLPPVAEGTLRETESVRMTVGHRAQLSNAVELHNRFTFNSYHEDQDFDAVSEDFVAVNSREFDHFDFESLLHYSPTESFRFTAGFNWQRMKDFFEYTLVPMLGTNHEVVKIDDRDLHSVFGQFSWQVNDPLRLVVGLRAEELGLYGREVYANYFAEDRVDIGRPTAGKRITTPRVSLIYQPDEAHVWKFMAGDSARMPVAPNDAFEPEKVRTLELNYTRTSEAMLFSASLFRNSASNLLIEDLEFSFSGFLDTDALPTGKLETTGLEVITAYDFGDNFRLEVAGTWQDSDSNGQPQGVASYSPSVVAHAKAVYHSGEFSAALIGRYIDSMYPFFSTDLQDPSQGRFIGEKIGGYGVLDANLRWNDVWNGMFVSIQLTNLLGKEYRFPNNPVNSLYLDRGLLGRSRGVQVTAGFKF